MSLVPRVLRQPSVPPSTGRCLVLSRTLSLGSLQINDKMSVTEAT